MEHPEVKNPTTKNLEGFSEIHKMKLQLEVVVSRNRRLNGNVSKKIDDKTDRDLKIIFNIRTFKTTFKHIANH